MLNQPEKKKKKRILEYEALKVRVTNYGYTKQRGISSHQRFSKRHLLRDLTAGS